MFSFEAAPYILLLLSLLRVVWSANGDGRALTYKGWCALTYKACSNLLNELQICLCG